MKIRTTATIVFLLLLLFAGIALRLLITRQVDGSITLAIPQQEFVLYRVVPLISALIVGAGLGVSGMGLQVLLRNSLASPWILGLSSGAGLGVMATMYVEHTYGTTFVGSESGGAILGAVGTLSLVYVLSR
ncbi:MAG: ABC-type Fe3+-siderophore transport system permease subunit, partial [Phycisphaerales bacterium]